MAPDLKLQLINSSIPSQFLKDLILRKSHQILFNNYLAIQTILKNNQNSALEVEVKMLREKIEDANLEREREREQASEQIESLRGQIERQSADHRQALAAIADQRPQHTAKPPRRFFGLLKG